MSTVKWLESKIISETQRAKYAEGRVHALLLELDKKDAALRRAKAEVLELATKELCMYCNDPGNWAPMSNSGYHLHNKSGRHLLARCYATKIHALKHALNARAAQIEEGE